jgi:2-iminoacetate synthase
MERTQHHYLLPKLDEVIRQSSALSQAELQALLQNESVISDDPQKRAAQALALFSCDAIATESIRVRGQYRVEQTATEKETFVPIFVTNHCHADCAMCGMRRSNDELVRKFSGRQAIEEQLRILREVDGVQGVGFLTGEYQDKYTRYVNAFYIGWAIHTALRFGFRKIFFNIGSMTPDEISVLAEWLDEGDERVTMCVFQETYNVDRYQRFMTDRRGDVPKADFERRLSSFDNWLDAGFKTVNPGFLVGLHDVREELVQLLLHVGHLSHRGARIYVSLPRLRPALGFSNKAKVEDAVYERLIAVVAYLSPHTGIVLTTREDMAFQDRLLPLVRTLSPGSPDVAPYRWGQDAPNDERSSQFLIPDHRRPRDILARMTQHGYRFRYFALPQVPASAGRPTAIHQTAKEVP